MVDTRYQSCVRMILPIHYRAESVERIVRFSGTNCYQLRINYVRGGAFAECSVCMTNAATCKLPCSHEICASCRRSIGGVIFRCPFCRKSIYGKADFTDLTKLPIQCLGLLGTREHKQFWFSVFTENILGEKPLVGLLSTDVPNCDVVSMTQKLHQQIPMGVMYKKTDFVAEGNTYSSWIRYGYTVSELCNDKFSLSLRWCAMFTKSEYPTDYFLPSLLAQTTRLHFNALSGSYMETSGLLQQPLKLIGLAIAKEYKVNHFLEMCLKGLASFENTIFEEGIKLLTSADVSTITNEISMIRFLKNFKPNLLVETSDGNLKIIVLDSKTILHVDDNLQAYNVLDIGKTISITEQVWFQLALAYDVVRHCYRTGPMWDFVAELISYGTSAKSNTFRFEHDAETPVSKQDLILRAYTLTHSSDS